MSRGFCSQTYLIILNKTTICLPAFRFVFPYYTQKLTSSQQNFLRK
nr:MAG TPA: hypothetical protein [Caudoviricetes sp.]